MVQEFFFIYHNKTRNMKGAVGYEFCCDAGQTPLHCAVAAKCICTHGCRKCVWKYNTVELLVEDSSCQVNATDNEGNTALHMVTASITDTSTARLLIRKGIDVNAVNKEGKTVLHFVAAMKCELSRERFTKSRYS